MFTRVFPTIFNFIDFRCLRQVSLDRLPILWSAPELLANPPVWNPKSDVWSFGVLLWEIFSLGSTPYPFCATEEAVFDRVRSGWRLTAPTIVPRQLESLFSHFLSSCWGAVGQRDSRPPFSELLLFLRQLLVLPESAPAHVSDVATKACGSSSWHARKPVQKRSCSGSGAAMFLKKTSNA
nr:unnamed protein product [Spirometra erinaceieuropaei]